MFKTDTTKLDIRSTSSKNVFSISHILEPKDLKEKRGKSFLVIQLELDEEIAIKISEIIKDIFTAEYYKDPYKNPTYGPKSISTLFEQAVGKVNKSLGTLESEGYVSWKNNIHVVICTIKNSEIHLAYTGKSKALLLRDNAFMEMSQPNTRKGNRIFAQTVSGVIKNDDIILLSTPELLNYISKEKIRRTLTNKGVAKTESEMRTILTEVDSVDAIASLFIHIKPITPLLSKDTPVPEPQKDTTSHSDITLPEKPTITQEETSEKKPYLVGRKIRGSFEIPKNNQPLSTENYTDPTPQPKTTVPQKITRFIESIFDNYLNTKAKGKILGIAAGVIGIILIFTIGGTYISNKNKAAEAKTEEILADARQKEQEASNAIIYRDYNTAELLLTDAQQQIENELDEKTREESEVKDLLLKIATDFDKINKVNRVNTNLIATLPSSINTPELTGTGDALFAISKEDAKVFELNRNEQTFDEFSNEANGISEIQFAEYNEEKDTIAFLTQSSIAEMPLFSGNISNNGDDFARDDHAFSAMTIYQDRIYLLDPNNNQIYRHTRTVDGYGLGKEWIDDEAIDITDAVSIAIDANVYVLKKDGTVLKLNVGEQEDFNLSGISDPFSENTQIITNENMNYLYILDKEHSLLAVFSKKGELLNQYAINLPDTITDFHVDEENQIVYMLTNSEVHSIDIQE